MLKLSIITINLNNAIGLEKTIKSVVDQTFQDIEFIVIDGDSKDKSVEIIKKHANKISYWVSEKDSGIYNAMNKGIKKASGEYFLFLNSGDFLFDKNVLKKIFFETHFQEDIIYGNMMIDWNNGKITLGKMPNSITFHHMFMDTLWHPISFIKNELFNKYGCYDESYKLLGDYDFFFKTIIMNNVSTRHVPTPISVFCVDGLSSLPENKMIEKEERSTILKKYLSQSVIDFANDYMKEIGSKKENKMASLIRKFKQKISK